MPPMKNVFSLASPEPCQATCDLTGEGRRTTTYFHLLFDIAIASHQQLHGPDLTPLAAYIQLVASTPECQRRHANTATPKYTLDSVKDFIICPACHQEAVQPHLGHPNWPLTNHITPHEDSPTYICDFYSTRMRRIWEDANRRNDYAYLTRMCQERNAKLAEIDPKIGVLVKERNALKSQTDLHQRVSASMQQGARIAQLGAMGGGPFGLGMNPRFVVDYSGANAQMARAMEVARQVDDVSARIEGLLREYEEYE